MKRKGRKGEQMKDGEYEWEEVRYSVQLHY